MIYYLNYSCNSIDSCLEHMQCTSFYNGMKLPENGLRLPKQVSSRDIMNWQIETVQFQNVTEDAE
jgi:hypothetical protein